MHLAWLPPPRLPACEQEREERGALFSLGEHRTGLPGSPSLHGLWLRNRDGTHFPGKIYDIYDTDNNVNMFGKYPNNKVVRLCVLLWHVTLFVWLAG